MTFRRLVFTAAALLMATLTTGFPAEAHIPIAKLKKQVRIVPKIDQKIPLGLQFRDAAGRRVELARLVGKKPLVLAMVYYDCPMLCSLLMKGMIQSLNTLSLDMGKDFQVATISVNPLEKPADALRKRNQMQHLYSRKGFDDGWHFLTGKKEAIQKIASAVGVHYAYDPEKKQYAHPAAIIILTPKGKISRYLYGIEFAPRDLRLALVDAGGGKIGSIPDQLFLLCYQYDPLKGKYGFAIMSALRAAGVVTTIFIGAFVLIMVRRERKG